MTLTDAEREYLASQRLGRLATVGPDGTPQNNPVAFFYNEQTGTLDIGGYRMGETQKFRNARRNPRVAFVVDDIVSVQPWRVRGVQLRGRAEALADVTPPQGGFSREIIRIHPERITSWGLDPGAQRPESRTASAA